MAADLKPWPTCPTCTQPYVVIVGLPVTITRAGQSDRFVETGLDVVEAHDLDDGATLSCDCGTIDLDDDSDDAEAAYAAMTAVLAELPRLRPVTAIYDRTDVAEWAHGG